MNTVNIIHLADLHIGSKADRSAEYREIFDKLGKELANIKRPAVVIIAGDIFHHKTYYLGQDVADFNYLIKILIDSALPTLIIPGNHDTNLAANSIGEYPPDLISPLLRRVPHDSVKYVKKTGRVIFGGIPFYHISVFDMAEQIIVPDDAHGHILLYHGMIDSAKFGKTAASGTRITTDVIKNFSAVIAGDIHQRQIWRVKKGAETVPVAYSGSLIQQNRGEELDKGFLIWTVKVGPVASDASLANATTIVGPIPDPEFRCLPNRFGFIRFDLRGLTIEESRKAIEAIVAPENVLKISILSDHNIDGLKKQISHISDRFGRGPDSVIHKYEGLAARPTEDALLALEELLRRHKTSEDHIRKILDLHRETIVEATAGKWHVVKMEWSDLLSYGPDNAIDFTALEGGISGVIAPNRAGKSSIFDILVLGLFGMTIRGDSGSIRRDGCKVGEVRVHFIANGVEYSIKRIERGLKPGPKVTLLQKIDEGWINASETSSRATYEKIRGMIGTLNQFLATALYYGGRNDIIEMSKGDRMTALSALFGGDNIEKTIKKVSAELRRAELTAAKLPTPRIENPAGVIAEAEAKLADVRKAMSPAVINDIDEKLAKYKGRSRGEVQREITSANRTVANINRQLDELEKKITPGPSSSTKAVAGPADYITAKMKPRPIDVIEADLATANIEAGVAAVAAETASATIAALEAEIGRRSQLQKQLAAARQRLRPDVIVPPMASAVNIDLAQVTLAIGSAETELGRIEMKPTNDALVATLMARVEKLKASSKLKFSPDCADCAVNIGHLSGELAGAQAELATAVQAQKLAQGHNDETRRRREHLSAVITEGRQKVQAYHDFEKAAAARSQALAQNATNAEVQAVISNITAQLESDDVETRLAAAKNAKALATQTKKRVDDFTKEQAAAKKVADARGRIEAAAAYQRFCLRAEQTQLIAQLHSAQDTVAALTTELETAIDDKIIADLKATKLAAQKAMTMAAEEAGRLTSIIDTAKAEKIIADQYAEQRPALDETIAIYRRYSEVLNKDGFLAAVIGRQVATVVERANALLETITKYDGSSRPPFYLRSVIEAKQIELFIDEHEPGKEPVSRPVSLASGFQKFIISIIFRFALTMNLHASAEFICIDEGFGCMDSVNLSRLVDMFTTITPLYRGIFIISHIPELNAMITHKLTIKLKPYSHISNVAAIEVPEVVVDEKTPDDNMAECPCGKRIRKSSLRNHTKSKFHLKWAADQ